MRQWLEKIGWKLEQFMRGRNGTDSLSNFLTAVAMILLVASFIPEVSWLVFVSLAIFIYSMFRSYSKKLDKRRAENAAWLKLTKPMREGWRLMRRRFADRKTHRYFKCKRCGQYLRVPKGKGKIVVTCKNCGERFEARS